MIFLTKIWVQRKLNVTQMQVFWDWREYSKVESLQIFWRIMRNNFFLSNWSFYVYLG